MNQKNAKQNKIWIQNNSFWALAIIIGHWGSLFLVMKTNKRFFNSYNKEGRKNNVYADTRPVRVDVFETRDADSHHRLRLVRENLRVGENEGTF